MTALHRLIASKTFPGILLLFSAVLAMVVANTPLQSLYHTVLNHHFLVQVGSFQIDKPLLLWINDGLMAIFFLLVGLEVKREVVKGHLSSREQASLPLIAAVGGFLLPACIYVAINYNNAEAIRGWAIPAATDIAFALGVMMLLGDRVSSHLKVCLVAIAVIDDLFAVMVIAFFYTDNLAFDYLLWGLAGLTVAFLMNWRHMTSLTLYMIVGVFVWACILKSGIHPTLAGVAMGLLIPIKERSQHDEIPLKVLEHHLHPWVSFLVLPLFAFANAGVSLQGISFQTFLNPITLGIMLGLFVGKQLGIMGVTALACRFNLCHLPRGCTWMEFYGLALLTGIGFTMSLFIGNLAFVDDTMHSAVRLGVLSGSLLSAVCGTIVLMSIASSKKENA